jgi:serine/threonine-protein kinase
MKPTLPDATGGSSPPVEGTGTSAPPDAAEQLWQLWRRGQRPEVDAFLARAGPLSPDRVAAVLRVDQRERWQAGEHILAEMYLQRHPQLQAETETAVDLIFNEFLLREKLGERPGPEEYLRRFPEYGSILGPQIELHRALGLGTATFSGRAAAGTPGVAFPGSAAWPAHSPQGLVLGAAAQSKQELQTLLRRRLFFLALVVFGSYVLYAPIVLLMSSASAIVFGIVLATSGAFGGLLWSRRPLSLRALRGVELVLFGTQVLYNLWAGYEFYRERWLDTLATHDEIGMIFASQSLSWNWLLTIFVYGIVIPNTWRRCVLVVGVLALGAVVLHFAGGLLQSAVEPRLLVIFLSMMVIDVGLASVIAVFGAHRLETLRTAAAEARKLGQYQLKQLLGAGGMGEVYLAEHQFLRRPCALKLIRPERAGDPTSLRRFEHEVQVTATLTHPNTIEIFDYGHAADGTFYYVMEYLPGPNLEQLVHRHGPLPPERAIHLLRQVCGSLAEAHAIGLIHRDIKPSNIIACRRGGRDDVAKLLDFGLATGHGLGEGGSKLTQEGALTGTPAYMSPEQAAGREAVDGRSDIYSLGAVAYFLLTGQPPFLRPTAVQTLAAHLGEAVVPPSRLRPGLPAGLEAVALKCLEKDPAQRFPNVAALDQALAQCGDTALPKSPSV